MLKSDGTIIPVFYNVKPSDLRWTDKGKNTDRVYAEALRILRQTGRYSVFLHALRILRWTGKDSVYVQALRNVSWTGSDRVYAKALLNHEKKGRYGQEKLAAWRKALADVSYLSGFELDACNGDEGELVDEVARQVQKRVRKTPLHVATHPTGLDEKLQDFERTVLLEEQQHRSGAILLGIMGFGGVGKTTLAKEYFNRNESHYQRSCFLAEVRDAAARNNLISLQGQLWTDLTGVPSKICSIDEGIGKLRRHRSYSQSLIILDDVDHHEQLDALFSPVKDVLPSGSLILVTSRDKSVLRKPAAIEESSIYHLTGLGSDHSQELFCSYAFHQPRPAAGYEELVGEFLDACQGLPLYLKVIGALLHSESPEYWEDQLQKLSQVLPTEIQSKLQISYDSLDKQEKEIFLDIACFFIGIERGTAIRLWDGSGWKGSLGFGTLESKCLVTLDEENRIRMHDHLRDLGRDLAEKEPPGGPRRLWRPTDTLFRNVPTQSTVRGISMVPQRYDESFQSPAELSNRIVDISGLQLLRAPCDCLESLFKVMRHSDLLWLSCEIYPFSSRPSWIEINNSDSSLASWIPIKNLRVLELQHWFWFGNDNIPNIPILGTLWNTESQAPLQLRELNISFDLFQLPKSIEQLKYLEKIELPNFKGTLPEEFFHLRSLKYLRLQAGMKSLPDSLGNFTNLQHIDLSGCFDLNTLPSSFGNLTRLQHVKLAGCFTMKMLPDSFMNLIRLKHLDLSDCSNLTFSSRTLGNISTLERLNFSYCDKIEVLPPQVTHQQSLEELILDFMQLKELPSAIGYLRQVTSLSIAGCPIFKVPFASVEKVQGGRRLLDFSIDKCMFRLKSLNLSRTRITEISFGEGVCPVLESLDLACCDCLVEVGALPTTLTSLFLCYCCALKKITGFRGLAKLRSLEMSGCKEIEELPGLGVWELDSLRNLNLEECPISVVSFASVEKVRGGRRLLTSSIDKCMFRLKSLNLSRTRITEISFCEGVFPVLESVNLVGCDDLVEVRAFPTTLTSLKLTGCGALKKITGLRGLAKLRTLYMSRCKEIEERCGLGLRELNNLEYLNLQECPISVVRFASVEKVQGGRTLLDSSIDKCMLRLKSLDLSKARITEISFGEAVCPVLQWLNLAGCDDLVEVGALPTTLTSLKLTRCCALKKITGLGGLAELRTLDMSGCKQIEELSVLGVRELKNLEDLNLQECPISVVQFASVEKVQGGRTLLDSSVDKCMLRLKSLDLSKARITEISFGEGVCPVLESLDMAGCDDLVEVGALPTTLTSLKLSDCCALKKITGLRGLAKLRSLDMIRCKEIEELSGLGVRELNNLEDLKLRECPISVVQFASVEKVQEGRTLLESSIDNCMHRLKSLDLSKTRITEISFGEGVCPYLQWINPAGCDDLVEVGAMPTTLTSLDLSDCCALKKITGLRGLAKLRTLDMSRCKEIEELSDLGMRELNNLEDLNLQECPISVVQFASVEKIQGGRTLSDSSIDKCMLQLKALDLSKARITEISFGEGVCPVLESLNLAGCDDLIEVGALPTTLTSLDLSDCCALRKITGLRGLAKLRTLDMSGCKEIEELSGLVVRELKNLEDLNLQECPISAVQFASVEKIQGGRTLLDSSVDKCMPQLKALDLSKARITEISFGEGVCPVLESLNISNCDDLVEVGALPTTLTSLHLTGCCALKKIMGLRGLTKLGYLYMRGCKYIELPGLIVRELNNLEHLYLGECPISVVSFASVEKVQGGCILLDSSIDTIDKCMFRLKYLNLEMTRITEISFGEGVCPVLESLDLSGCDDLVEVGALPTALTSLCLRNCCALKKITGLRGLAKLLYLNMARCYAVEELPGLETLISLTQFWTSECENMKRIRVLAEAANSESDVLKKVIQLMERDTVKEWGNLFEEDDISSMYGEEENLSEEDDVG